MDLEELYTSLHHNNSGSISKNRFGYEMAVGIEKLIENYDMYDEYCIVFDYVCDVEFHYKNDEKSTLHFYQVKTKDSIKPFDATYLTAKGKKKNSIIGTLYKLYNPSEKCDIKLYIVGNVPFNDDGSIINSVNGMSFSKMSSKTKNKILTQLKDEKIIEDGVELNDLTYVYNPLNILNYDITMLGKLIAFYNEKIDKNIVKPKVLYSSIKDCVIEKASFEQSGNSYDEILKNKGIKKSEFKKMLLNHKQRSNNIIEKCVVELKTAKSNNISDTLKIKKALMAIIENNDTESKKIMDLISQNIEDALNNFSGNLNEFIEDYIKNNNFVFSEDNDYYEKYAYVLYQYVKIMEVADE